MNITAPHSRYRMFPGEIFHAVMRLNDAQQGNAEVQCKSPIDTKRSLSSFADTSAQFSVKRLKVDDASESPTSPQTVISRHVNTSIAAS